MKGFKEGILIYLFSCALSWPLTNQDKLQEGVSNGGSLTMGVCGVCKAYVRCLL